MSTIRRVASGTMAAWIRLLTMFAAQLVFVPISLKYWDQETLGLWLAMQAILAIMQVPDIAFQSYLDAEFLKIGPERKQEICQIYSDGCGISLGLAVIEMTIVILLCFCGALGYVAGLTNAQPDGLAACNVFAIGNALIWLVFGAVEGIAVRLLIPFGYFARVTWWGTVAGLVLAVVPILVVWFHGTIWHVVIWYLVARSFVATCLAIDLIRLFRRESLTLMRPQWSQGFQHWVRSTILLVEGYTEQLRQQGIRLVLGPVSGTSGVSKFSTIRTGANLALQGMSVISGPVVPELMRYVRHKDQPKLNAGVALVWVGLLSLLAPAIIVIQYFAPWGFHLWTRGKVTFDPLMFAWFSVGVLLYGLAQPAISIVRANNLLRQQLLISASVACVTLVSVFGMVEVAGLRGAAIALVFVEAYATTCYVLTAHFWLFKSAMAWPWVHFRWASAGTTSASIATIALGTDWEAAKWIALFASFGWGAAILGLIRSLPDDAQNSMRQYFLQQIKRRTNQNQPAPSSHAATPQNSD